jgi:predicted MPP superfamily phosphohydrolase
MNQLFKLHVGLFKYLKTELPKKKTLKEIIKFLKPIVIAYPKELLRQYKTLFLVLDSTYQKQKKEYDKYQKIKKELQQALKMLQYVDNKLEKSGVNRQRRRQFWRDFYRDGQCRKDVFEDLLKEINQIK